MNDVGNSTSSGNESGGGLPLGAGLQPVPQPDQVLQSTEIITSVSASSTQVGAKEHNLMFLITGCSGLFLSNTLALAAVVWNFHNVTYDLPAVVLPEWAVGFIFSTYGSAVVVWVQNKLEKALSKETPKK